MAVCGQFDAETIESFAKDIANTLSAMGEEYTFTTPEWGTEKEITMHLPDRNQSHLLMVFPTHGKTDLETTAKLELLKAILSGQSKKYKL